MSGYGRRESERGYSRDYDRERSPGGRGRRDYRDSRDYRDRRDDYGRDRGRTSEHGPDRESNRLREAVPQLPDNVPIPANTGHALDSQLPRNSRGTVGRPIKVLANHYVIQSLPIIKIYQYEVRMTIPLDSQRRGISTMSPIHLEKGWNALEATGVLGGIFVTDRVSTGWSSDMILEEGVKEDQLILDLPGHKPDRPNQIQVQIRCVGKLNIAGLVKWMTAGDASTTFSGDMSIDDCFRLMNALFKDGPSKRFISFPKSTSYFTREPSLVQVLQSSGGVLEAIRGIFLSVSAGFNCLSLNIDTKCAAFWRGGIPATQLVQSGVDVTGVYFIVKHLNPAQNQMKKRIRGISNRNAIDTTFSIDAPGTNNPITTSVQAYFLNKYGIRLQRPQDNLVDCGKYGLLPPELMWTADGERYKDALQGSATSDFIKWATTPAFIRKDHITANVARIANWNDQKTAAMGLSVSPKMMELPALILPPALPRYRNQTIGQTDASRGSWNLRGLQFTQPASFASWGMLCFDGMARPTPQRILFDLANKLSQSMRGHAMGIPGSEPAVVYGSLQKPSDANLQEVIGAVCNKFRVKKPDLIVILLPQNAPVDIYKSCKQILEVLHGIPSQFLISEKAMGGPKAGSPQYCSNVAMKINAKLGGVNWTVSDPLLEQENVLILGADVTHPSAAELRGKRETPSFASLVGSIDSLCSKYTAVCVAQPATKELIEPNTLAAMTREILKRSKDNGNRPPNLVLYLRDGVSDSQIPALLSIEVKALKQVRDDLGLNFKLVAVNVLKRHHTRFFPQDRQFADKLGNVLPGCVVENSIKHNDIYLVSQSALQGTVRPTRYKQIYDERGLTITEFERLLNSGCYGYQRATRSVSLHPAVYYADLCAERAKLHVRTNDAGEFVLRDVHVDLQHTQYWL